MKRVDKPTPVTVIVELTEEEATILCALVGNVCGIYPNHKVSDTVVDFYNLLNDALPKRERSFSDFFTGDLRVRKQ